MAYSENKKIGGLDQFTAAGQTPLGDPLLGDNDNLIVEQSGTAKRARVIDLIKKVFNLTTTFTNTNTSDTAIVVKNDGSFGKISLNSLVPQSSVTNDMLVGPIPDTKLATISTPNKVADGATSATPGFNVGNTAYDSANNDKIVKRNNSGNFAAGTITATLSGNASTATNISGKTANAILFQSAPSVTGQIVSDNSTSGKFLKSNGPNTPPTWESFAATSTVADDLTIAGPGIVYQTAANVTTWLANGSSVGSVLSSNGTSNQPVWVAAQATPATGDTIVKRDGSGNFTGQTITANVGFSGGSFSGTTGTFSGAVSGATGTFSGAVSGTTGTFSGAVSTGALTSTTGSFSGAVSTGALTSTTGSFSGAVSGTTGTFSGAVSTGTLSSGNQLIRGGVGGEGGQLELNNPDNASIGLILDVASANVGRLFLGATSGTPELQIGQLQGTGGFVRVFTASTERMRITADGNVGIGTATPQRRLQSTVTTAPGGTLSAKTGLLIQNLDGTGTSGSPNSAAIQFAYDPASPRGYIESGTLGLDFMAFGFGTTERLRITADGNVGIGTTVPQGGVTGTNFHVYGATAASIRVNNPNDVMDMFVTSGVGFLQTATNIPMVIRTNSVERLRITADGNVGIGTSSPLAKLNIAGSLRVDGAQTAYTGIQLINASGAEAQFHANGNGSVDLRAVTNHPLTILTNNQERLRITADGNVGIGTNIPTQKLDVNGVVNATGFRQNGARVIPRWCSFNSTTVGISGFVGSGIQSNVQWSATNSEFIVNLDENVNDYVVVVTGNINDVCWVREKFPGFFRVKVGNGVRTVSLNIVVHSIQ